MDSSSDDYTLFLLINLVWNSICDRQVLAFVTCDSPTESIPGHVVQVLRLDITEIFSQISICVRLRVSEVNLIIVTLKGMSESEGIVASLVVCLLRLVFPVIVLEVREVLASSIPSFLAFVLLLS